MNRQETFFRVVGALLGALGSAGLVAVAGGAILWGRFQASQLPADQAVAAVPQRELMVVGAVALAGFLIAGVVALVGVYVLDRCGTPGKRTRRGLIALMVAEIIVGSAFAGFGWLSTVILALALSAAGSVLAVLLDKAAEHASRRSDARSVRWSSAAHWHGLARDVGLGGRSSPVALAVLLLGTLVVGFVKQELLVALWVVLLLLVLAIWLIAASKQDKVRRARVIGIALILYGAIALARFEESLALVTAAALALGLLNLAVARATGDRFVFYGVSVFLSVVLFGGLLSYVRTRENPKLQPVAALMTDGRGNECGLYVTETDTRLYLARVRVAIEGRKAKVADRSGRIFWLPQKNIERSSLGPLQDVVSAQEDAADLREELDEDRQRGKGAEQLGSKVAKDKGEIALAVGANECAPGRKALPPRQTEARPLAKRFQPRLILDRADGFWPISVLTIFDLQHGRRRTCRQLADSCARVAKANQLPWIGGTGEWLEYPGPDTDERRQQRDMVAALGSADPASTAREYFLATGGEDAPLSLQYWFFYPFNYQKLGSHGVTIGRAGYHEGDFETVGLLLSRESRRPVYVWMARHAASEGRPFTWAESALDHPRDRLNVYGALGSHASYESCSEKRRRQLPRGLINDRPQCAGLQQLVIEPQVTPLADLSYAPWACWHGNFGHTKRKRIIPHEKEVFADGPVSPLWQQGFGGADRKPCDSVDAQPNRPDAGEEVLDEGTATNLRQNGGRLDPLFNTCEKWRRPPSSGVYVVACDQKALRSFFESGLEDLGEDTITIRGPGAPKAESESVPAVYRRPEAADLDGLRLTAKRNSVADVYAVCYSGENQIIATFRRVPLLAGRAVSLRTGDSRWTIAGRSVAPATAAKTARCEGVVGPK